VGGDSGGPQQRTTGVTNLDHVLIAIATYKRPDGLYALLKSLETSTSRSFDVLVVDNDASGSARTIVQASPLSIRYVVEPKPGIAAARNRAVDEFEEYEAVVFVDDDEYVSKGWLDRLLEYAAHSDAGVITGPVQSIFPAGAPNWVVKGGFIQRPFWPHGSILTAGATNNTLVKIREWTRAGSPRFDDTFSATGGSDAKFFSELLAQGTRIEYCATAIVFEPVLAERMKLKWLVRRGYRNGIVSARIWALKHGSVRTLLKGLLMTVNGLIRTLGDLVLGRGWRASSVNAFLNGLGVISALIGIRVHEYKRKPQTAILP